MQILAFSVEGFRSLADTAEIPVRRPTILTGANDGGKTSAIRMLGFLLGDPQPKADDFTRLQGHDPAEEIVAERCIVTGRVAIGVADREVLDLPERVAEAQLRRVAEPGASSRYEIQTEVPLDPNLRDFEDLNVAQLRVRADALSLSCPGHQGHRETFLAPLRERARTSEMTMKWSRVADQRLRPLLPRFVLFSSTREPDVRNDIRQALQAHYEQLLTDEDRVGRISDLEQELQTEVATAATALRDHIKQRCPDLSIDVIPQVSFKAGLNNVDVRTGTEDVTDVALDASGAGRRRRITLAVWEWTQQILAETMSDDSPVVIAYDEPDTHLDYLNQRELVELIRKQAATPGARVVVATHSLNLIDRVEISDVVHLTLDAGRTTVRLLVEDEHDEITEFLQQLAAAMGLRNSVLLHERCFVVVEGPTEQYAVPVLFRLATGMSLQACGLALIVGDGNEGALKLARTLVQQSRPVWVVVDHDSFTNPSSRREFSRDKLARYGIPESHVLTVGGPHELEDTFGDDQWAECARRHWPRADGVWQPSHFAALRGKETKFSTALDDLVRTHSEDAPRSKTEYVTTLARDLTSPDHLPRSLFDVLQRLRTAAL